jgi:hypothetical protein
VVLGGDVEEAVQVEVEETILKELQQSFVGVLALSIELSRIKSVLYMEGFAHISITDMGRNLVLLFSPRVGELEKLCKTKPDWFSYYFKLVRPWSPSLFADRRDVWVKVFGIPLHVWGENLFKCIGNRYGEFLDFDDKTASRSKLDVARLKISTFFRGAIDEPLKIKAMGEEYTIWITEDKGLEPVFVQREVVDDHDQSWADSAYFQAEAKVVLGSVSCGSVAATVEEEDVGDRVDPSLGQHHTHGEEHIVDGDGSLGVEGLSHTLHSKSEDNLVAKEGNTAQVLVRQEGFVESEDQVSGPVVEKGGKGVGEALGNQCLLEDVQREIVTSERKNKEKGESGPQEVHCEFNAPFSWSTGVFEKRVNQTRSLSVPPGRTVDPVGDLGRVVGDGLDYSDTISLVEVRGGVCSNPGYQPQDKDLGAKNSSLAIRTFTQRGRSRTSSRRSKRAMVGAPKFIQLAEAVKDGGGKSKRRKKKISMAVDSNSSVESSVGVKSTLPQENEAVSVRPVSGNGTILEVILPVSQQNNLLAVGDVGDDFISSNVVLGDLEASKLLKIQKEVGFCYKENDDAVVQILSDEELRDRTKKAEWEHRSSDQ